MVVLRRALQEWQELNGPRKDPQELNGLKKSFVRRGSPGKLNGPRKDPRSGRS